MGRVHDGFGDFVADEPGGDAVHPLCDVGFLLAFLAEFAHVDVVAVVQLAVVGLRLLDERDGVGVGFDDARQDAEQAGHLQRVRLDVDVRHVGVAEHLPVDFGLLFVLEDVREVDALGPVVERLHLLVALLLSVLRHVRPPDDDLVDVDSGVVLRLDGLFLRGVQEVVEELSLELQQFLAGEDAAVRVTERAGVVERPRVGLAVHRELRVVDVAGEFCLA